MKSKGFFSQVSRWNPLGFSCCFAPFCRDTSSGVDG
jgi:hypothetical protein